MPLFSRAEGFSRKCISMISLAFLRGIGYNSNRNIYAAEGGTTMENENMIPEEEVSILTLTDENGAEVEFEYLDVIEYEGKEYLILMPVDEISTEIIILEVEPVDEENENYLSVTDEAVLEAVYAIFKEKFQDVLEFED